MMIMLICGKDSYSQYAKIILESYFDKDNFVVVEGKEGDCFDQENIYYHPDYILCFNSPWTLSKEMINSAEKDCIYIQDGTEECFGKYSAYVTLFENMPCFGAVAYSVKKEYKMCARRLFHVGNNETVDSLITKSKVFQLTIFSEIVENISMGNKPVYIDVLSKESEIKQCEIEGIVKISRGFPKERVERIIQLCQNAAVKPYITIDGEKYIISKE